MHCIPHYMLGKCIMNNFNGNINIINFTVNQFLKEISTWYKKLGMLEITVPAT